MHILHLEDETPLREIMKVALIAAEPAATLRQFGNSDEAMRYIEAHVNEIDLYILDVRLPGSLDGVGVARRVRELGGSGVIVITSAYRAPDRTRLQEMNAEWYAKPWHIMEVLDKLLPVVRAKIKG